MLRFAVLWHEMPDNSRRASHFDLLLEDDGTLRTWTFEQLPERGESVSGHELPRHRLAYLEYEGEVSGNRGTVRRVAGGLYQLIESKPGRMCLGLVSDEISGKLELVRQAVLIEPAGHTEVSQTPKESPNQLWTISRPAAFASR